MSDQEKNIHCSTHGQRTAAFICQHLFSGIDKGFNIGYDPERPEDPCPDAWCDECEKLLAQAEGEWNQENEKFAGIKLICSACYMAARLRNQAEHLRRKYTFSGLQNAEENHRESPRTFLIPRSVERASLAPGRLAKLIFEIREQEEGLPGAERMWVEIIERLPDGYYKGVLTNKPYFIADLSEASNISFGPEHIAAVDCDSDNQLNESKLASCAAEIVNDDVWPGFAQREQQGGNDSGWRIYPHPKRDSNEMIALKIEELLKIFPILDSILSEPEGTSWRWNDDDFEYKCASQQ